MGTNISPRIGGRGRMQLLRKMFGPSKAEAWKQLSEQIHAEFRPGGFLTADRVVAKVDAWLVTLDTTSEPVGRATVTCTRIRAPFVNHDKFRFLVYDKGLIDDIGKRVGLQDIEIGDKSFDARFILQANDEAKMRAFLADTALRDLMLRQAPFHFEIKDDEGWFGETFPQGVDELYFQTVGVVRDLDQLKEMYALFAEALHQLCHIGSAYENEPASVG